ncbi:hypothetical protein EB118_20100 [bacterium]|nr:hypothetical protein [Actinomycetota bacterium]NDG32365.1 hypothetical protein [bacterium]
MPRRSKKEIENSKITSSLNVLAVDTQSQTNELPKLPTLLSESQNNVAPNRKKQPKKNFVVVASVGPNGIQGNLMPEVRKPLIAHLQIQTKDIMEFNSNIHYNPNPPPVIEAFNSNEIDNFIENPERVSEEQDDNKDAYKNILMKQDNLTPQQSKQNIEQVQPSAATAPQQPPMNFYKRNDNILLAQYKDSDETKMIPEKSDVACLWCCHTFENRPCIIPSRDLGTHLQVYGNFCCPECAMAYLFDQRMDAHSRWEQLSLLNRVYGDMVGGNGVFVAPSRSVLKLFGGPYTIEQYRELIRSHKYRVDVHLPPMVSILATMDTKPIDFYDASISKTILETAQERVARAEEVLRLKRTKPLKAWESTLDACMNIRVGVVKN